MEFSLSELYLIIWALIASAFALYYKMKMKEQNSEQSFMLVIMGKSLRDIAEGKATAKLKNGQLVIEPCVEQKFEA